MKIRYGGFLAVALAIFSACGNSDESRSREALLREIGATGIGNYLGQSPARTEQQGQWEGSFFNPAEGRAICLFGTEYQVSIRRGASSNVMLYLEGGGACWNASTCLDLQTAKRTANWPIESGILDANRSDNPFRDWSVVYASYCDGSVFGGDNVVTYRDVTTYHHGIHNLAAALTLMQREFPSPAKVLVTGSSAGGYGTLSGMGMAKLVYPGQANWVLNDAGPGIQNLGDTTGMEQREQNWRFLQFFPASCTRCREQPASLYEWAIERDPDLRVGIFSSLQDNVVRVFLLLDGPAYEELLRQVTDDLVSRVGDRLRRFFISGEMHTILLRPEVYTLRLGGISMAEWAEALVNNDGAGWPDLVAE